MRILVIGANGFIGSYLFDLIKGKHDVTGTSTHDRNFEILNIAEFGKTSKFLHKINPDAIYLPAGITNLDYIENHQNETRKVNVLGTRNIANYCKVNNCKLVFFSSDAIFDGRKGPYSENDGPNPVSIYGKQKLEAENIVKKLDKSVIIRTSSVYGWDKRNLNFVSRLVFELRNGKNFKAPVDQFYTPTYTVDLTKAALKLLDKKYKGVYNVTGPDFISRYEIALNVCRIFDLDKKLVVPVKSSELNQNANRGKHNGLLNKKIVKDLGIKFHNLKEGLKDMKRHEK